MKPACIIDNRPKPQHKLRMIRLEQLQILQEIDAHTYKFVDAAGAGTPQQQNAIASDTEEHLDGAIIQRLMDYRDSQLRLLIEDALQKETVLVADNIIDAQPDYIYKLKLDLDFNDGILKPLAQLFHKYIIWGALFDWYSQMGNAQANVYATQLKDIEREIESKLYPGGYARRPLQPFGPAQKIY